jgi:transglutaminase-like putative cysteine protease
VLTPEGTVRAVDESTVHLASIGRDDIFDDDFRVSLPLPELRPGALALFEWVRTHGTQHRSLPWSHVYYPRTFNPIERFTLNLTWDQGVAPPAWRTDLDAVDCDDSGERTLRCEARELAPYPKDPDVSYHDVLPTLVVAEAVSWREFGAAVSRMIDGAMSAEHERDLRNELATRLDPANSDEQKLAIIHDFVAREIRYVGLEGGEGALVPRDPVTTLRRRYGDCKDKTVLFVALARLAGLHAWPVLTNAARTQPSKLLLPAVDWFDHMVGCTSLAGDEYCVDLTDPYTGWDSPSTATNGRVRLDLGVAGESPAGAPSRFAASKYLWDLKVVSSNTFDPGGELVETTERRHTGFYGALLRQRYTELSPDELQDQLAEHFRRTVGDASRVAVSVSGLERLTRSVDVSTEAHWTGIGSSDETTRYHEQEPWLRNMVHGMRSRNRHHSYRFDGLRYEGHTRFVLPSGQAPGHVGPDLAYESPYGRFTRTYTRTDTGLEVRSFVEIPRRRVAVAEIARFNSFLDLVAESTRMWFELPGNHRGRERAARELGSHHEARVSGKRSIGAL